MSDDAHALAVRRPGLFPSLARFRSVKIRTPTVSQQRATRPASALELTRLHVLSRGRRIGPRTAQRNDRATPEARPASRAFFSLHDSWAAAWLRARRPSCELYMDGRRYRDGDMSPPPMYRQGPLEPSPSTRLGVPRRESTAVGPPPNGRMVVAWPRWRRIEVRGGKEHVCSSLPAAKLGEAIYLYVCPYDLPFDGRCKERKTAWFLSQQGRHAADTAAPHLHVCPQIPPPPGPTAMAAAQVRRLRRVERALERAKQESTGSGARDSVPSQRQTRGRERHGENSNLRPPASARCSHETIVRRSDATPALLPIAAAAATGRRPAMPYATDYGRGRWGGNSSAAAGITASQQPPRRACVIDNGESSSAEECELCRAKFDFRSRGHTSI
ncbi:hypothetical protein CDD83_9498 [Cordyceps sp. RAO-2017]|nr:hypothetical protein CDD83_9498 [Cordyceps sp. RAO-2017]